ncbi:hypothetical protein NEMBOFW57_003335 [Staphylotrichum longicolle]|uniref:Uncharacterized protein n=1 Tax=Staphylotrichum longicolle TaxID=669026 RepID=A0AAD4F5T8_9PEZI|nr:hypothetical protein NEMBOFW57_003335 [Staphylotrichum longicolle]
MEVLTEFYLTTVWEYKPKVVHQIIDELFGLEYDQAEFAYDDEYSWFRVICQENDANAIRQQFGLIARRIEADAFDKYEDDLLHLDDTLMTCFDNEWFSREIRDASALEVEEVEESDGNPPPQTLHPYTKVWGDLDSDDNERYTIDHIVNNIEFEELGKELQVMLSIDLARKLVSIAGHSEESISRAQEKLTNLLRMRVNTSLWAENVLYAEDYVEPGGAEFTADVRYLVNIDPKLASSTLLDRVLVDSLEESYKTLYRAGSSIRLCSWAPDKGFRVSLLGPKVNVHPKDRTTLGNRPIVTARTVGELAAVTGEVGLAQMPQSLDTTRQVETWIERLSVQPDSVPGPVQSLLDAQVADRSEAVSTSEDLIDLIDEPLTYRLAMALTLGTKPQFK